MRIPDYITTAQTNLMRTKVRTFLTILAFVIGTFTLAMVTSFTQGLRTYINTQLSAYGQTNEMDITIASKAQQSTANGVPYYQPNRKVTQTGGRGHGGATTFYSLNQSDLNKVKATPGIIAAYPTYPEISVDYIQYKTSPKLVISIQSAYPQQNTKLDSGSYPSVNQTNGIVLPFSYIQALGFQDSSQMLGKTVELQLTSTLTDQPKQYSAIVTGVLPDTVHQPAAYVASQLMSQMSAFQNGSINTFNSIVAYTKPNPTKTERTEIKNAVQAKGYQVQDYDDIISNFSRPLSIVTAGLTGFAAIALLAATIGIINTLLMSVLERTQEIGLLKALGMRQGGITLIYLIEAASIGFWGGIIGVIFAFLLGLIANPILTRTLFKGIGSSHILTFPLPYMAGIVVGAMIIGLLAGTLPAIRAGRLNPIDALRRE
ncbi:MAG TPA: ABC transporter permease [Candidatus Saccharimonadales bacterium]|nr:ABC transporter permease [Candidatus Saccharimonadales bacterium]